MNNTVVGKIVFLCIIIAMLFSLAVGVSSNEQEIKYKDLEKREIDEESNVPLKEYYADILGKLKTRDDPKFNTIAEKDDIAIINVTIDGKDKRILTKLSKGTIFPSKTDTQLTTAINLVVLGNISLKGVLYSEVNDLFGLRRLYGVESTELRYVDEGISRLINGKANISVNPILSGLIDSYSIYLSL